MLRSNLIFTHLPIICPNISVNMRNFTGLTVQTIRQSSILNLDNAKHKILNVSQIMSKNNHDWKGFVKIEECLAKVVCTFLCRAILWRHVCMHQLQIKSAVISDPEYLVFHDLLEFFFAVCKHEDYFTLFLDMCMR